MLHVACHVAGETILFVRKSLSREPELNDAYVWLTILLQRPQKAKLSSAQNAVMKAAHKADDKAWKRCTGPYRIV